MDITVFHARFMDLNTHVGPVLGTVFKKIHFHPNSDNNSCVSISRHDTSWRRTRHATSVSPPRRHQIQDRLMRIASDILS